MAPIQDTLTVLHVLPAQHTFSDSSSESESDSDGMEGVVNDRSCNSTTIQGFLIPIGGIISRAFTRSRNHNHLVKSFMLTEIGLKTSTLLEGPSAGIGTNAGMGFDHSHGEGDFNLVDYDFLSGRIVLSLSGAEGVAVLDFDDRRV